MGNQRRLGIRLTSIPLVLSLIGCTISQRVSPVEQMGTKQVCILEDPAVRPGFLKEYRNTLEVKGYNVRVLPRNAGVDACKVTSTYLGKWSWDLAIYLSIAEIRVYEDGRLIGEAVYDSRSGGGRIFDKFVDGETKIRELVNLLYP